MTPGRANFEAYKASREGLTHDGKPMHSWGELPDGDASRQAWEAGAAAAIAWAAHRETLADVEAELSEGAQ